MIARHPSTIVRLALFVGWTRSADVPVDVPGTRRIRGYRIRRLWRLRGQSLTVSRKYEDINMSRVPPESARSVTWLGTARNGLTVEALRLASYFYSRDTRLSEVTPVGGDEGKRKKEEKNRIIKIDRGTSDSCAMRWHCPWHCPAYLQNKTCGNVAQSHFLITEIRTWS